MMIIGLVLLAIIVAVAVAVVVATVVVPVMFGAVWAVHARLTRFQRCPVCGVKALEKTAETPISGRWKGGPCRVSQLMLQHLRCRACAAEFCCEESGPLIWKDAWDAGARSALPEARLLS